MDDKRSQDPDVHDAMPSPGEASAMLDRAAAAVARTRLEGRWLVRYLLGFGVASALLIPPMAFLRDWRVAVALGVLWAAAMGALFWPAFRHRATSRGGLSRAGGAFMLFGLIFGVTCVVGFGPFAGNVAWWLPAGLASAAPWLIAAVREARR